MSPEHLRHKPLSPLDQPRQLILGCPRFKSNVNLSRIVRLAGCVAAEKLVVEGKAKIDSRIARDGVTEVPLDRRNSLGPALKKLRDEGYQLVGLEQTDQSECLFDFSFEQKTVLVIGHERLGITDDLLPLMDRLIEIPVYGLPFSYNVVTATTMAVYEYCRQYPRG